MKPNQAAEQAHADIRELFARVTGNYEPTAEEVERLYSGLTEILGPLAVQVTHWQANHADMVVRNKILMERPDLPVDRTPVYLEVKRMQENQRKVDGLIKALTEIRDEEFGSRHHTDVAMEALAEFGMCQDEGCPAYGEPHAHVEVPDRSCFEPQTPAQILDSVRRAAAHAGAPMLPKELIPCELGCGCVVSLARQACGILQCANCLPDVTPITTKTISYTAREADVVVYLVEGRSKADPLRKFIERVLG